MVTIINITENNGQKVVSARELYQFLGYDISNWYGLAAPRGTPQAIVSKLNHEVSRVLNAADLRQTFEKEAIDVIGSTPDVFGDYLKTELVKWGHLVKSSGLRVE